ncbi:MAG: hypothetical protein ABSH26_11585 [Opitutaceae bacterium]|jgi:hypothetical protein
MTEPPSPSTRLLEAVATATVAATSEPFAVRERFERPAGIRFATVWNEFKRRFYGKTEGPIPETLLRKYRLLRIAPDAPIIAELGGEAKVECPVAAAYALIRLQGGGEEGILQVNGYANIFYVRDLKGALCAVRIGWDGEGWVIDAISVEDPLAWNGKHEIFCPVSAG